MLAAQAEGTPGSISADHEEACSSAVGIRNLFHKDFAPGAVANNATMRYWFSFAW